MSDKMSIRKKIDEEKKRMQQLWEIRQSVDKLYMEVALGLDELLNEYDKILREEEWLSDSKGFIRYGAAFLIAFFYKSLVIVKTYDKNATGLPGRWQAWFVEYPFYYRFLIPLILTYATITKRVKPFVR